MYISKREHILSKALCQTALVRLGGEAINSAARMAVNKTQILRPDMLNSTIELISNTVSALQVIITVAIFCAAYKKLDHIRNVIPKDDFAEMAKLQEELGDGNMSTLSSYSIMQLLKLWAAILIGIQMVYDVTSKLYQNFVAQLSLIVDLSDFNVANAFVNLYNNTHGFKYNGMLISICLGVYITGVFLKDIKLQGASVLLVMVFMFSFVIVQMHSVTVMNRTVGIVWSSVIFHMLQTVGMFALSIYLSKKYRGL